MLFYTPVSREKERFGAKVKRRQVKPKRKRRKKKTKKNVRFGVKKPGKEEANRKKKKKSQKSIYRSETRRRLYGNKKKRINPHLSSVQSPFYKFYIWF